MGWKGTVRSLQTAANQAQREAQRRQREQERQQARLAKMAELERAAAEVELFDEYVESLETIHATEVAEVDWEAIAESDPPSEPSRSDRHESAARRAVNEFKPKLLESKKKQAQRLAGLEAAVSTAIEKDEAEYRKALEQHQRDLDEWRVSKDLARGVLEGEAQALAEAANQIEDMVGAENLRYLEFTISDGDPMRATVGVISIEDVVPSEQRSLLASGKLSVKQMPKGRYFELYQDYVCGSALLVANAVLGMLPVPDLIVTAKAEMLDTTTGHLDETPILSVYVPRETIGRLNLVAADASDAMSNFAHNMKFLKTKGFQPVEPISRPSSE